jgi:protein ImuA
MQRAGSSIALSELRAWLERVEGGAAARRGVLPFGIPEVDQYLPGEGLPRGSLHEIIEAGAASEYASVAVLFAAGIAARLKGPVLWCLRGRDLFQPALARVGLHPDRVVYCETWNDREVLPAMEEGLRCRGLAAVVGELVRLPLTASRRLQLAAEREGVTALVVRRWRNAKERALAEQPTSSATRWRVTPTPHAALNVLGLARPCWRVELIRCRGGEPHSWMLEACDAQGCLALPASVAERPLAAQAWRAATG